MVFHPSIDSIILTNSFKKTQELKQCLKLAYIAIFNGTCNFTQSPNSPFSIIVNEQKVETVNGCKNSIYTIKHQQEPAKIVRRRTLLDRKKELMAHIRDSSKTKNYENDIHQEDSKVCDLFALLNFAKS